MVKATKGVLVNWYIADIALLGSFLLSDPSVKQILLQLDAEMHFIIEDLDGQHMFVDESQLEAVQGLVEERLAQNIFKPD